ncbi:MAG TPA: MFS transporter [Rhizomicrobium sp.]|jgi:MHS family alpha-ketoglutarate permease-like MFS transporter|nr:MFS transporter [Rhizomicrobium sp.]
MTGEMTAGRRFKAIFAGSVGNLVQWYDWYIYSSAALYFAPVFFPKGNQTAQLLQAAVVFFVGFLARPIGAWAMGHYGDRVGRKAALKLAVAMMATGSLAIALCPGASSIGVWASVILVLARIFQGLSLGGEYGASATYISEMAGRKHRGFWSSFNYVTLLGGNLIALSVLIILQTLLTADEMREYGWRIPFAVGALLSVFAYWLREKMEESQSFALAKAQGVKSGNVLTLIQKHPRETLIIIGMTAGGTLIFYVYTVYMPKFLVNTAGFSPLHATQMSALALFLFMFCQPLVGFISDKLGRKQVLAVSYAASMLATYPILSAIAGRPSMTVAFGLVFLGMVLQSGYTATGSVVKAELFPTSVRTLGVGLPYAIANTLFGGSAESLALWFKSIGHETAFYIYTSVVLVFSFLVALMLPDTRLTSKILED